MYVFHADSAIIPNGSPAAVETLTPGTTSSHEAKTRAKGEAASEREYWMETAAAQLARSRALARTHAIAETQYDAGARLLSGSHTWSILILLEPTQGLVRYTESGVVLPTWLTSFLTPELGAQASVRVAAPTGTAINAFMDDFWLHYPDITGESDGNIEKTAAKLASSIAGWVPAFNVILPVGPISRIAAKQASSMFANVHVAPTVERAHQSIITGAQEIVSSMVQLRYQPKVRRTCISEEESKLATQNYLCTNKTTGRVTCGFCGQSRFAKYLEQTAKRLRALKESECKRLVTFGVAFGNAHFDLMKKRQMDAASAAALHQKHGHCFFRFVLKEDLLEEGADGIQDTLHLLIPLERDSLPFDGGRRNVKIIKMLGHLIFPWAERLLWVDAKLNIGSLDPLEFFQRTVEKKEVCVTFMGLPEHANCFGAGQKRSFQKHAETILRVSKGARVGVTDNQQAIRTQTRSYVKETNNSAHLDDFLIDSAYIARSLGTQRCRQFNAALGCYWFNEIQCFSDRDQLSFPYVLHKLGAYAPSYRDPGILLDKNSQPIVNILEPGTKFVAATSLLHWYFSTAVANFPGHQTKAAEPKRTERSQHQTKAAEPKRTERSQHDPHHRRSYMRKQKLARLVGLSQAETRSRRGNGGSKTMSRAA